MVVTSRTIRRIMIIGGPGAGKTWLALRLGLRYEIPVHSVDDHVWDERGAVRPDEAIDARMRQLALSETWIIEGGNSRTYGDRARRADVIIRLAPPNWQRLYRMLFRDGMRVELLRWTLKYDRVFGPKDEAVLQGRGVATIGVELRSREDFDRLLMVGVDGF